MQPRLSTRRFRTLSASDLQLNGTFLFAANATEGTSAASSMGQSGARLPRALYSNRRAVWRRHSGSKPWRFSSSPLRNETAISSLVQGDLVYLDVSGLGHQVWAPILRLAERCVADLRIVYVEPRGYRPHPSPASPTIFDLSTSFGGLAPLPGFARLAGPPDENQTLLVAMLGLRAVVPAAWLRSSTRYRK